MKSYLTLTGIDLQITLSPLKVKDELELDSNNLKLHYKPVSDNVIFDICDQNGKIYYSGNINGELTVCNIGEIAKGSYVVYVIDSGEIHKKPIKF